MATDDPEQPTLSSIGQVLLLVYLFVFKLQIFDIFWVKFNCFQLTNLAREVVRRDWKCSRASPFWATTTCRELFCGGLYTAVSFSPAPKFQIELTHTLLFCLFVLLSRLLYFSVEKVFRAAKSKFFEHNEVILGGLLSNRDIHIYKT